MDRNKMFTKFKYFALSTEKLIQKYPIFTGFIECLPKYLRSKLCKELSQKEKIFTQIQTVQLQCGMTSFQSGTSRSSG